MRRLPSTTAAALAVAVLASSLAAPTRAEAQAWIREPGSAFASLAYRVIRADRFYAPDGDTLPINDFRQHTLALYGEVGLVDRWLMATLDGELLRRSVLVDQGATTGLGDLRLGLWTGLLEAPFRLSLGLQVGLPTGDPSPEADGDPLSQTTADLLPTGDGEVDVALKLAAGHGFGWRRVQQFVQAELGYVLRTTPRDTPASLPPPTDIRDQLAYRAETGLRIDRPFLERFWWIVRVAGLLVVQDRGADTSSGAPRIAGLGDGVEYLSIGVEVLAELGAGFGLSFGVDGAAYARNVPAAPAWKIGLTWQR